MGKLDFPKALWLPPATKCPTSQLSDTIETKAVPVNRIGAWRASGFTDDASTAVLLWESADHRIKKIALTDQGLEYTATEMILKPGELAIVMAKLSYQLREGIARQDRSP